MIKRYKNKKGKAEEGEVGVKVGMRRAYKRKAGKVCPVNVSGDGQAVDGDPGWKKKTVAAEKRVGKQVFRGPNEHILIPRLSDKPRGFRHTDDGVQAVDIGDTLRERERELLVLILYNREPALAFDMTEIGLFSSDIEFSHVIHAIPHDPSQEAPFKTPRALEDEDIDIIKVGLETGIVERARSVYCNLWFLVRKKAGGHHLVNFSTNSNRYTILDAALPPSVDQFSDEFVGMAIVSIINLLSGYD